MELNHQTKALQTFPYRLGSAPSRETLNVSYKDCPCVCPNPARDPFGTRFMVGANDNTIFFNTKPYRIVVVQNKYFTLYPLVMVGG